MILATAIANGSVADVIALVGASAVFKIYAGAVPASCELAPGALLARIALPAVWLSIAGQKVGTWLETSGDGTGTATYFRVYDATEATCGLQGLVGTELLLDSPDLVAGADFCVTRFSLTGTGESMTCRARGRSLYRRLVRSMYREVGSTYALVKYRLLLRDLKAAMSIPVSDADYLYAQDGDVLTTQSGVPFGGPG